jgi:hypothetical protein
MTDLPVNLGCLEGGAMSISPSESSESRLSEFEEPSWAIGTEGTAAVIVNVIGVVVVI